MSNLRELTNSELDIASGGAQAVYKIAEPVRNPIVTLIRIVESLEGCNSGGKVAVHKIPAQDTTSSCANCGAGSQLSPSGPAFSQPHATAAPCRPD